MGWVVNATLRPLYPREIPGTHCIGDWVGHRAGLDRCGKSRPPPGFDPRTVQPVHEYVIPVHAMKHIWEWRYSTTRWGRAIVKESDFVLIALLGLKLVAALLLYGLLSIWVSP